MDGSNDATMVVDADCAIPLTHAARFSAPDPLAERMLAMLIRITGEDPPFVAGVVFGDDGRVVKFAPIVKWAKGLDHDQLRAEIRKRGLKAAYVKTLTAQEIEAS